MSIAVDSGRKATKQNKQTNEVAITCAFGRRLRMGTISAVPTRTANMHVRATLRKYRVLRYLIWFWEEKCSQKCLPVCLECSF